MHHKDIRAGDWLSLKPARKEAYGLNEGDLLVLDVVPRPGYKVSWIRCQMDAFNIGFFRPEDFRGFSNYHAIPSLPRVAPC